MGDWAVNLPTGYWPISGLIGPSGIVAGDPAAGNTGTTPGGGFSTQGAVSAADLAAQAAAGAFDNLNSSVIGGGAPIGGGGGGNYSFGRGGSSVTLATNPAAPISAPATTATSSTSGILSLLESPVYSGSSITWGWVLIGGVVLWLLMRRS